MKCEKCGSNSIVMESRGVFILNRTCCSKGGADEMIVPRAGKPGSTAMDVVLSLAKEFPRDDNSGICRYCGMGMYEGNCPDLADSHEDDCPWVMANTVAGRAGAMQ